jgi:hypothetical protein
VIRRASIWCRSVHDDTGPAAEDRVAALACHPTCYRGLVCRRICFLGHADRPVTGVCLFVCSWKGQTTEPLSSFASGFGVATGALSQEDCSSHRDMIFGYGEAFGKLVDSAKKRRWEQGLDGDLPLLMCKLLDLLRQLSDGVVILLVLLRHFLLVLLHHSHKHFVQLFVGL